METEKIQSLRDWVADNKGESLTPARRTLMLEILDAALVARRKAADRLAKHRGTEKPKTAQRGRKAAKKPLQAIGQEAPPAPKMPEGVPVSKTLDRIDRLTFPTDVRFLPPVGAGQKIAREKFCSHSPIKVPSALPKAFQSVLDRVKLPSQIKFDPTAAQGKPAKKK